MLNARPMNARGGSRHPFYSPERDIGYVGAQALKAAMAALDQQHWEDGWFKDFLRTYNVDVAGLAEGAKRLAQAYNQITRWGENPVTCLERSGFTQLPTPIQMAVYTKMGQIFWGLLHAGIADTTLQDRPPTSMAEIIQSANEVQSRLAKSAQVGDADAGPDGEKLLDDPTRAAGDDDAEQGPVAGRADG